MSTRLVRQDKENGEDFANAVKNLQLSQKWGNTDNHTTPINIGTLCG